MKNNKQIIYSIIEFLYFTILAAMYGFASLYLLDKGFSNSQIGLVLAISSVLAILLQQLVTQFIKKTKYNLNKLLVYLYIVVALLSLFIYIFKLSGIAFAIALVIVFFIEKGSEPFITAIQSGYKEIQFSISRGIGSLGYSVSYFVIGQLLAKDASDYLPIIYFVPSVLIVVFLILFKAQNVTQSEEVKRKDNTSLMHDYPHFCWFVIGVALISITHNFTELYLLQIITRVNGTSANLGIAAAISAFTELPAMALYKKYYKKLGNRNLLMFAGVMWSVKNILIALSPNIYFVYLAELLQFFSFSIYVPSTERFLSHVLPKEEYLRGQTLISSALVVGSLIASLLGGVLIDALGINIALMIMQSFAIVGAILFIFSMKRSLKIAPRDKKS